MSSLSDIQQIYSLLIEIDRLLKTIDVNLERTEKQSKRNTESFRQLEAAAMRYLLIARRMGLPEEVNALLTKVSQVIVAIRQLELTVYAAQAALAGAGPIGWLVLGASAAYTALSFYSIAG